VIHSLVLQEQGHQAPQHDEDGKRGQHDSGNGRYLHGFCVFCGLVPVHGADDLEVIVKPGCCADDHDGEHPIQIQTRIDDVHERNHFGEKSGRQRHARQQLAQLHSVLPLWGEFHSL